MVEYFSKLERDMRENGITELDVWNMDETGFLYISGLARSGGRNKGAAFYRFRHPAPFGLSSFRPNFLIDSSMVTRSQSAAIRASIDPSLLGTSGAPAKFSQCIWCSAV